MATNWYWRVGDEEKGPVTFHELAMMVRQLELNEDDLVRPSYSSDWQTADEVVGLFYMAGRVAELRKKEAVAEEISAVHEGESEDYEDSQNEYRLRLSALPNRQYGASTSIHDSQSAGFAGAEGQGVEPPLNELDTLPLNSDESLPELAVSSIESASSLESKSEVTGVPDGSMAAAIAAAADAWDERHPTAGELCPAVQSTREPLLHLLLAPIYRLAGSIGNLGASIVGAILWIGQRLGIGAFCRWLERVASRRVLSIGYRAFITLGAATLAAWGVFAWSDYETMRYPNAAWVATGRRLFPLFGPCSQSEFYFLLADVLVVVAVVAYFGAKLTEQLADD